jgi:hypothetical protein
VALSPVSDSEGIVNKILMYCSDVSERNVVITSIHWCHDLSYGTYC